MLKQTPYTGHPIIRQKLINSHKQNELFKIEVRLKIKKIPVFC